MPRAAVTVRTPWGLRRSDRSFWRSCSEQRRVMEIPAIGGDPGLRNGWKVASSTLGICPP